VAQLYPQTLGTHFSRLLRHEWVTVGLFFNPGHRTGFMVNCLVQVFKCRRSGPVAKKQVSKRTVQISLQFWRLCHYSPHFRRKSLRGVGSSAVRGESVLVGGLKCCYWWKTV
jgi:hypothetical protein